MFFLHIHLLIDDFILKKNNLVYFTFLQKIKNIKEFYAKFFVIFEA